MVTYANEAKERLLGVPHDMLCAHGAVSPEVARAMAQGARKYSGADYGIGITAWPGPAAARRKSLWALCTLP